MKGKTPKALTAEQQDALLHIHQHFRGDWRTVGGGKVPLRAVRALAAAGYVELRAKHGGNVRIGSGWGAGQTEPRMVPSKPLFYAKLTPAGMEAVERISSSE
jgi:hypothetical protein